MLLFAFILSWALIRAFEEIRNDTAGEFRATRARAQAALRGHVTRIRSQHKLTHPKRIALESGIAAYVITRTAVRGTRYGFRSARRGWARGWSEGRARHAAYAATRSGITQPAQPAPAEVAGVSPDGRTGASPASPPAQADPDAPQRTDAGAEPVPADADHAAGDPTPPTEGEDSMPTAIVTSGEAPNIEAARSALTAINQTAAQAVTAIDNLSASLAEAEMDPATLGEVADILDAANALKAAAEKALAGMNSRHAVVEEAINSTPHVAKKEFYQH